MRASAGERDARNHTHNSAQQGRMRRTRIRQIKIRQIKIRQFSQL